MRRFSCLLWLCILALPAQAASEGKNETPPQYTVAEALADPQKREILLNELYNRLKASPSDTDAVRVEATITALMQKTGNAASDLFMQWGEASVKAGSLALALDYMDMAVQLNPNAPELYFKRATVHYGLNDFSKALADLERAHLLEPRHMGVLLGLGTLFSDLDRNREALSAYSQVLSLNPHNANAQKIVGPLRRRVEGENI